MRLVLGFVTLFCLLATALAANGGGFVPQAFYGCNVAKLRNCRYWADNGMF